MQLMMNKRQQKSYVPSPGREVGPVAHYQTIPCRQDEPPSHDLEAKILDTQPAQKKILAKTKPDEGKQLPEAAGVFYLLDQDISAARQRMQSLQEHTDRVRKRNEEASARIAAEVVLQKAKRQVARAKCFEIAQAS